MDKAKELCEDLIANVKDQYEEFKNRPPRTFNGGGGRGGGYGDRGYGDRSQGHGHSQGYGNDHGNSNAYHGGYDNHRRHDNHQHSAANSYSNSPVPVVGSSASPPAAVASPIADYTAAQYAQYTAAAGTADPYAAYGGYNA